MFLFIKRNTSYEMRIMFWSSDLCASDLCRETELAMDKPSWTSGTECTERLSPAAVATICPVRSSDALEGHSRAATEIYRRSREWPVLLTLARRHQTGSW